MPARSKHPVPTLPAQLFENKRVAVAGRFSYSPSKDDLLAFLKQEGAVLVGQVTDDLDLLIVGSGAKPAMQKQVEKRNAAGAGIQICDDIEQLVQPANYSSVGNLTDPATLAHLCSLPYFVWGSACTLNYVGEDFSGLAIDGGESGCTAGFLKFEACNFSKSTIRNLVISDLFRHYAHSPQTSILQCTFDKAILDNVKFSSVDGSTFDRAELKSVDFRLLKNSSLVGAKLDRIGMDCMEQCTLEQCTMKDWKLASYHNHAVRDCQILRCKISGLTAVRDEQCVVHKARLQDVVISAANMENLSFDNCVLERVEVRDSTLGKLEFNGCELIDCKFTNVKLSCLHLTDSTTATACSMHKSSCSVVIADSKHLTGIVGLGESSLHQDLSKLTQLQELASTILAASRLEFSISGTNPIGEQVLLQLVRDYTLTFSYATNNSPDSTTFRKRGFGKARTDEVVEGLLRLVRESEASEFDLGSLQSKTSKSPVKANELKQLIVRALYEALGKEPRTPEELAEAQRQAKAEVQALQVQMIEELEKQNVKAFNKRTAGERQQVGTLKKLQLANNSLQKLNASSLDLSESDFSGADCSLGNFSKCGFRKANFRGTNLSNANLNQANLRGADLSNANLSGAQLQDATLSEAIFVGTVFDHADFKGTSLLGVDLSKSKLEGAKLADALYDEKTLLPSSMPLEALQKMHWTGGGIPPHERKQNEQASGPLDFAQFMERLNEITDSARLKKSMQMLKKDSFKLFCEVTDSSVAGVVKSQSDAELVYSCVLNDQGEFTCCTQNLNPCGGLRGAICKHILVLIVGLAKGNELDPTKIDQWVNLSKRRSPSLDKDRMSEILLKYKGAEAGEIDWRPTETVPEDFFTF